MKRARGDDPAPSASASASSSVADAEHRLAQRSRDARGLRCVAPYAHSYSAHAKSRWLGRGLADFYCSEYGALDRGYVEAAVAAGAITVNGSRVGAGHIIRNNDLLRRWLHQHEPRVPGEAVRIVARTPSLLVACKPAGMPVHASGPYRYNTLLSLLVAEHGLSLTELSPVHRLDRLTSGLVILARSRTAAREMSAAMASGRLRKRYVTELEGDFPRHPDPQVAEWGASRAAPDASAAAPSTGAGAVLSAMAALAARGGIASRVEAVSAAAGEAGGSGAGSCKTASSESAEHLATTLEATGSAEWPFLADCAGEPDDAEATAACPFLRGFSPVVDSGSGGAGGGAATEGSGGGGGGGGGGDEEDGLPPTAGQPGTACWTRGGWLRVRTGIAGVDIRNCVAAVVAVPTEGLSTPAARGDAAVGGTSSSAAAAPAAAAQRPPGAGDHGAKSCETLFRALSTRRVADASAPGGLRVTTLVEVAPITGRTHQIRVHAAWLGHVVRDDPIYCPRLRASLRAVDALAAGVRRQALAGVGGRAPAGSAGEAPALAAGDEALREAQELLRCGEHREWEEARRLREEGSGAPAEGGAAAAASATPAVAAPPPARGTSRQPATAPSEAELVALCAYCQRGPAAELNAQQLLCRGLRLHSLAYKGPGWSFACSPPEWAGGFKGSLNPA